MTNYKLPKVPENISAPFYEIGHIIADFCKTKFNEEYFDMSILLAAKIARKRPSPFLSGNAKTWAAGILHAIGLVNFLFDKSQKPHMTSAELCEWFALSQSTISAKSKVIRDMFNMSQMDPQWCLPSKMDDNPMAWLVSFNGYIVDVRNAPLEMQEEAYKAGVIPYIPGLKNNKNG